MRCLTIVALLVLTPAVSAQHRTQVYFKDPAGMKVYWFTLKNGKAEFSTTPLETPGRFNFVQGAAYRLKLTHIPGNPGLELFPTLEVHRPTTQPACEFIAHNSVPIVLTADDVNHVVKGSYLVKVVYLPTNQVDGAELNTVTGKDAVAEAARRGSVLIVLRIGNIVEPR